MPTEANFINLGDVYALMRMLWLSIEFLDTTLSTMTKGELRSVELVYRRKRSLGHSIQMACYRSALETPVYAYLLRTASQVAGPTSGSVWLPWQEFTTRLQTQHLIRHFTTSLCALRCRYPEVLQTPVRRTPVCEGRNRIFS